MAYKYTGGKTVTVTVGNLAQDTIACAYWYTGAVSPTGASYTIKGLLDDGNNSTSTDFSYNTVLKATASSPSSTSVTFKTVDNIYDSTNGRYPKYVLAYVKLLPHFHNSNTFGSAIKTANIEIRQRQNSISCNTSSITDYWNRGNVTQYTVKTAAVNYSPSNAYVSTMNVSSNNSAVASVSTSISNSAQLPITLKSKGTATITISPGDGAGGSAKTISVTSKTGVTSMSASYTGDLNTGASTSITVSKTPSNADATTFTISKASGSASIGSSASFGSSFGASATSSSPVLTFTSADGLVSKSIKITNHTATLSCSGSTPIKNQTFTYTKTGGYGTGTYTFSGCQHSSAGTATVTANSGSATVTWTPSDGGWARSASITLGVTPTSITFDSITVNKGGTAYIQAYMYGPNSSTPKYNSIVVTYSGSGTPSGWSQNSTVTTPATLKVTSINNTFTVTGKYSDSYGNTLSASGIISVKTPSASVARNTAATLGNEFTYTVSNYSGTGTWSFTGTTTSYVSTGKRKMSGNGTVTAKWTPADGGTAVTAQYTYNTGTTTLSKLLVTDNATYYGNGIYWDKYSVSMTNANGRKITVAVSYGYVGTTTSSTSTSISVASGTSIYIRRTASTSAAVTLSASAYTNAGTTSYTFYSKPSNVTFNVN